MNRDNSLGQLSNLSGGSSFGGGRRSSSPQDIMRHSPKILKKVQPKDASSPRLKQS
jgi:hypothetical protein